MVALVALMIGYVVGSSRATPTAAASPSPPASASSPTNIDTGFLQDMIVHHQQAVTMADIAMQRGDPAIRGLADFIRANQLEEIGQMQGLLSAWDEPWMSSAEPMAWMGADSEHSGHGENAAAGDPQSAEAVETDVPMPGMATQAQINRLQSIPRDEFRELFLTLMVRHHQGAVPMADAAAVDANVPAVQQMAQRMSYEQTEEVRQMVQALTST